MLEPRSNRVEQGFVHEGSGVVHARTIYNSTTFPKVWDTIATPLTRGDADYHAQESRQRTLYDALKFASIGRREHMVGRADRSTCAWLLTTAEYQRWEASCDDTARNCADRLLWIKGKAGSGKSTLMRFAIKKIQNNTRPTNEAGKDDLVVSHFFNARGSELEKSTEGMYRTLLVELIQQFDHLEDDLIRQVGPWMPDDGARWPLPQLQDLLEASVHSLKGRQVIFFVDALDECHDDRVHEMIAVFERLIEEASSSQQRVRVCFASRPYPHHDADKAIYLTLESQWEHQRDIETYVDSHLRIGNTPRALAIRDQVVQDHQHMFLWVKLVVEMLNHEHRSARPKNYERLLQGRHADLNTLFEEMIRREDEIVGDEDLDQDREARMLLFQWLLYGIDVSEYSPTEVWWLIQLGLGKMTADELVRESEEMEQVDFHRYISRISRGLVECNTELRAWISVHFIHESARAFALGKTEPSTCQDEQDRDEAEWQGHLRLKRCCEAVLDACKVPIDEVTSLENIWTQWQEDLMKRYPALDYACISLMYHADALQQRKKGDHGDQGEWLNQFYNRYKDRLWLFWNIYEGPVPVSLLDIFIADGLHALLDAPSCRALVLQDTQLALRRHQAPGIFVNGPGRQPLTRALEKQRCEDIVILVDIYLSIQPELRPPIAQRTLVQLAHTWTLPRLYLPRLSSAGLVLYTVERSETLATFFLIALMPDLANLGEDDCQALHECAETGWAATLNFILDRELQNDFILFWRAALSELLNWAENKGHARLTTTLRSARVQSRFVGRQAWAPRAEERHRQHYLEEKLGLRQQVEGKNTPPVDIDELLVSTASSANAYG